MYSFLYIHAPNEQFFMLVSQPPAGFQVDKWNLEALSEATLTRVAGSAMTVHMTHGCEGLVGSPPGGSQLVGVGVRVGFGECHGVPIPLWVGMNFFD